MTICRTPYQTSQCEGFTPGVQKTQSQLKAANATGSLHYLSPKMVLVEDGETFRNSIPGFTHPMLVDEKEHYHDHELPVLAADVRPFGAWSKNQDAFMVRDASGMEQAILRLRLSSIWLGEERNYLRNISSIPVKMYASVISESLQRKYGLQPLEQMHLSILSGIMYNSCFTNEKDLDDTERARLAASLSRDLGIEVREILPLVDKFPVISCINEFCKAAEEVCGVRLKGLSRGFVYASMGGYWFGYNFREVLATALEHPPTWIAIVYTAGTDKSYRQSGLTKLFDRSYKGAADQAFFGALKQVLKNFAPINEE